MAVLSLAHVPEATAGTNATPSCNSAEPALGYESKELEGGAVRVLFPSFPLADEARGHIQITGEDSLTGTLPQTERADFPGLQGGLLKTGSEGCFDRTFSWAGMNGSPLMAGFVPSEPNHLLW